MKVKEAIIGKKKRGKENKKERKKDVEKERNVDDNYNY
jgi:hypothetical protein